jgi:ATP-dependent protease HslVU (ClpYQ) peptidase subunit
MPYSQLMNQDISLLVTPAGNIMLPTKPLIDRTDGGRLVVLPARAVWDRTALSADELTQWSALVAACASNYRALTATEYEAIVSVTQNRLREKYQVEL